jgi:hypothetical protein
MISKFDTWGIVLAGHWNRMIFTPEWVGANLFHQEEIETEIMLMPIFPIIYRHNQVVMEASGAKLIFRPRFNTEASLEAAEMMAVTVLDDLPNTPLIGVGTNFSFTEKAPSRGLLELFNLGDARQIARTGWETPETKVTRRLTGEPGTMLLTLGQDAEGVVNIDINFHTDTPGATKAANTTARKAVAGQVVKLRDAALSFLHNTYKLQLEEG